LRALRNRDVSLSDHTNSGGHVSIGKYCGIHVTALCAALGRSDEGGVKNHSLGFRDIRSLRPIGLNIVRACIKNKIAMQHDV